MWAPTVGSYRPKDSVVNVNSAEKLNKMAPISDQKALERRNYVSVRHAKVCDRFLQKEMDDSLYNVFKKRE